MKTWKYLFKNLMPFLVLVLGFQAALAQNESNGLADAIATKQFVFKAQTVFPNFGAARQVTGEGYDVKLTGDSLVSYLPYFGRAYAAPLGTEGGIKFTSTQFDYAVKNRKKGGWNIVIKPADVSNFREFLLNVSENGSATLRALSNNRQPISFNGKIELKD